MVRSKYLAFLRVKLFSKEKVPSQLAKQDLGSAVPLQRITVGRPFESSSRMLDAHFDAQNFLLFCIYTSTCIYCTQIYCNAFSAVRKLCILIIHILSSCVVLFFTFFFDIV